jgi:signal transduction histidine kinase
MKKSPPTLLLLYVLLAYVLVQFSWWAFLIYDLNVELIYATSNQPTLELQDELRKKLYMILGEGTVFISLLFLGAIFIRRYAVREQRLAQQERNFLLATTHELNSPLAAAKLNFQTLNRKNLSEENTAKMIDSGLENMGRLEKLVSNILTASRIDSGKYQLKQAAQQLLPIVSLVFDRNRLMLEKEGIQMTIDIDAEIKVFVDENALEQVLENIIQNALKYAPNSAFSIEAREKDRFVSLVLKDDGPGLKAEDLRKIFNKFYRVENEETRSKKGTGLGLFLVKEIIEAHDGNISAYSKPGKGLEFKIELPKTR